MKISRFIIAISFIAIVFSSCKDDLDCCAFPKENVMLRWDGEPALDGCGFIFVFPDNSEKKVKDESEIDDSFKTSTPTSVEIEFNDLNEKITTCFAPTEFDAIQLISIERN